MFCAPSPNILFYLTATASWFPKHKLERYTLEIPNLLGSCGDGPKQGLTTIPTYNSFHCICHFIFEHFTANFDKWYVIQYLSGVSVSFDDICHNFCQIFPLGLRVIFQQIQILLFHFYTDYKGYKQNHTSYLSFFLHQHILRPGNFTLKSA